MKKGLLWIMLDIAGSVGCADTMGALSSPAVAQGARFVNQVPPETQEEVKKEMLETLLALQTRDDRRLLRHPEEPAQGSGDLCRNGR